MSEGAWDGFRREVRERDREALRVRLSGLLLPSTTRSGDAWGSLLITEGQDFDFLLYGVLVHLAASPPPFDPFSQKAQERTKAHLVGLTNPHGLWKLPLGYRKGAKVVLEPVSGVPEEWANKTSVGDLLDWIKSDAGAGGGGGGGGGGRGR